jgi:hypothetical protein
VTLASAVAGGVAFGLAELTGVLLGRGLTGSVVALVAGGGIGLGILATAASRMRISEATRILDAMRARLAGTGTTAK